MLGTVFVNTRGIAWLVNSTGNRMELDGYCEELSLAFEFNGEQHTKEVGFSKTDGERLAQRQEDDRQKLLLCEQHGVKLLVIDHTLKHKDLPFAIYNWLIQLGHTPLCHPSDIDIALMYTPEKMSEEDLLLGIKEFYVLNGFPPSYRQWLVFIKDKHYPTPNIYMQRFGSWQSAVSRAGFVPNPVGLASKYTKEGLVQILCEHAPKISGKLTEDRWNEYARARGLPSVGTFSKFFGRGSAAKSAAGQFSGGSDIEGLIALLVAYARENGCLPRPCAWSIYSRAKGFPQLSTYYRCFGSWSSALSLAKAQLAQDQLDQLNKEKNLKIHIFC